MDTKTRNLVLSVFVGIALWLIGGLVVNNSIGIVLVLLGIIIPGYALGSIMNSPAPVHKD
ncbi:MAG: hypothetical protein HKM01_06500 [Gallionella sp.]|nr:hypothetical protein [Gallionella sp.]NNM80087.1 hypothetical protein [Gallionella sp.]